MADPDFGRSERTRSSVIQLPWRGTGPRAVALWDGGNETRELPRRGELRIGRALDCELSIDHASVSRYHATLHVTDGGVVIEDCGSSNGTYVGGVRIGAQERRALAPGDYVQIGGAILVLQWPDEPASTSRGSEAAPAPSPDTFDAILTGVAGSFLDALILGETGVGKEVAAESIHARSRRAGGPLVKINCAALADTLLEAELFGYERGSFTGAQQAKPGLLESADGGTIFLDEVAELPLATQVKLLRVIENREVQRIGALRPSKIDARFVAATNRDVEADVAAGRFRADLFYRLAGIILRIAPLRERRAEIPALAQRIFAEACARAGRADLTLEGDAIAALCAQPLPGNVRELKRVLERAAALSPGRRVHAADLQFNRGSIQPASAPPPPVEMPGSRLAEMKRQQEAEHRKRIEDALIASQGNQGKAAEVLGVSRRTLLTWLDSYGFPRPRKR